MEAKVQRQQAEQEQQQQATQRENWQTRRKLGCPPLMEELLLVHCDTCTIGPAYSCRQSYTKSLPSVSG